MKERLSVVLVSPRNPLNIGAAARAMHSFGFGRLCVVNPYDVAFREARSAVGGAAVLQSAEVFGSVADAIADATLVVGTTAVGHRELQHPLRRFDAGARAIRRQMRTGTVALLFGSEKFGVSNEDMSHCHWLLRVPTMDQSHSMNLGQAVAVCLYEIARGGLPKAVEPKARKPAVAAEVEQITRMLIDAARESGYTKAMVAASSEQKIRRMVRRLDLTDADASLWLGLLRQVLWGLRRT